LQSIGKSTNKTVFGYDAEGDRTSKTPAPTKGTPASYTYDQADRMTGFSQGSTSAAYAYNGDGLRMSKSVDGGPTIQFTWNTQASVPLLLDDGTTMYIYGPDGLPLESVSNLGTVVFYHHNQLGSTKMLTSTKGKVLATYTYGTYGTLTAHSGTTTTPLLFDGQYLDTEAGLYYLRARYYDPNTGQFTSVDPMVLSTNAPYTYASDDPVNDLDPTGQFGWSSIVRVVAQVAVGTAVGGGCLFLTAGWGSVACLAAGGAAVGAFDNWMDPGSSHTLASYAWSAGVGAAFGALGGTVGLLLKDSLYAMYGLSLGLEVENQLLTAAPAHAGESSYGAPSPVRPKQGNTISSSQC
jgi:RHS repeat-associated protein